ncbi:outer membrane usher protein, partial [Pseudomonas fragi]
LNEQWSFSAANSWRSPGYRELEESTYERDDRNRASRYRDQQSLNLGWSHPILGAFSAGVSRLSNFAGDRRRRALASWGTSIGAVSLSASAEWQMGGSQQQDNAV